MELAAVRRALAAAAAAEAGRGDLEVGGLAAGVSPGDPTARSLIERAGDLPGN